MKIFLFYFLFFTSVYSKSVSHELVTGGFISTNNIEYTDIMQMKTLDDYNYYIGKDMYLKLVLDIQRAGDETYYIIAGANAHYVKSVSEPYTINNDSLVIKIDKNTANEIIISTKFPNISSGLLFEVFTEYEYTKIFPYEMMLYMLVYGLMFYAFLNALIFYRYNRQKSFLYYALLQLSLIILLLSLSVGIQLSGTYFEKINVYLLSVLIGIILAILFNMSFLNTDKYIPTFHKVLKIILGVYVINTLVVLIVQKNYLSLVIPEYVPFIFLIISAILVYFKGEKSAKYYLIGWSIILAGVFFMMAGLVNIRGIYILHIIFPLEAIAFSYALAYKTNEIQKEKLEHEQMLTQQNKLASMGEMLANIAHQWKQPLTHLSYAFMNLKEAYKQDKLSEEYFNKKTTQINKQINYMSNTIDDFKNFFKKDKDKTSFSLRSLVSETFTLFHSTCKEIVIKLDVECENDILIYSYKSELSQVIFNIFNNAKEVFIDRNISEPIIRVEIKKDFKYTYILIEDNAGGIDKKLIHKIFEPYFTTKKKGMGIGLYMSKMIIENNMNAKLESKNSNNGAIFKISFLNKTLKECT